MLRRTASLALLAASLGLGACVFGFRGEVMGPLEVNDE